MGWLRARLKLPRDAVLRLVRSKCVRLDGGLVNWRNAGADIDLTMQAADVVQALDSLGARVSTAASQPQRPGEIFLKAVGTPVQGLLATGSVKAAGLFFGYDGQVVLPAGGANKFDGEVRVSALNLGDALALAGLGSGGTLYGYPVVGSLKVVSAPSAMIGLFATLAPAAAATPGLPAI